MKIFIDTREQKAFSFRPCKRICLKEGDYTTAILHNKFHIERKSLPDLYGTLTKGYARFRREILRACSKGIVLVVVVEGSHRDFVNKNFPRGDQRKATTQALKRQIETIKRRYCLEFVFCKNRVQAKKKTLKRLIYEERKQVSKLSNAKNSIGTKLKKAG